MSLQNLQAELAFAILQNEEENDLVQPSKNIPIHLNNMQTNLRTALMHCYPLIIKLLGKNFFDDIAHRYIERYPSLTGNLDDYGEYLNDFITQYDPVKELAYLPEVAKFEWSCHVLSLASELTPFDIKRLDNISPSHYSNLQFIINPASQLHHFHYPILLILELCQSTKPSMLTLNQEDVYLLLLKRHDHVSLIALTASEYHFLKALNDNQSLADALAFTLTLDPLFKLDETLPKWIMQHIIVDYRLPNEIRKPV